jgi:hypothetical protein
LAALVSRSSFIRLEVGVGGHGSCDVDSETARGSEAFFESIAESDQFPHPLDDPALLFKRRKWDRGREDLAA